MALGQVGVRLLIMIFGVRRSRLPLAIHRDSAWCRFGNSRRDPFLPHHLGD